MFTALHTANNSSFPIREIHDFSLEKCLWRSILVLACIREHIATMVGPAASLNPLSRTDGSASYQCPSTGFNILSSVNAPIELPGRRDALKPEEATVEVFVKPGTGQAGVGEQYAKEIIKNMLAKLVLGREKGLPRRGIVVTLAVIGGESVGRGDPVSGDECMKVRVVI